MRMDLLTALKKHLGYSEFRPLQEQIAGFARAMVKEDSISRCFYERVARRRSCRGCVR